MKNGKDKEGGVKGLRKDYACLIIEIIICNDIPPQKISTVLYRGTN